ncbi:MAG: hypothetical protein AAFR65_04830 [Pseudomonadota bacterium]
MRPAAALLLIAVFLAGCVGTSLSDEPNSGPCPKVFVLEEAVRFVEFNGDERTLETVAFSGEITDVRLSCRYYADIPIRSQVEIDFEIGRGPAAEEMVYDLTYFVAVTRTDRDLIAKEEFTVPVRFRRNERVVSFKEDINRVIIPRFDPDISGGNFEVAVGFALTQRQVIFNRAGVSLKFPEA